MSANKQEPMEVDSDDVEMVEALQRFEEQQTATTSAGKGPEDMKLSQPKITQYCYKLRSAQKKKPFDPNVCRDCNVAITW